jgi:hypothetical protein
MVIGQPFILVVLVPVPVVRIADLPCGVLAHTFRRDDPCSPSPIPVTIEERERWLLSSYARSIRSVWIGDPVPITTVAGMMPEPL